MNKQLNVITIGYAGQLLDSESREFKRVQAYAKDLASLTMVVFSRSGQGTVPTVKMGNLRVIGTHSSTKLTMLLTAVRQVQALVKQFPPQTVVVTTQDPFMTSLVVTLAGVRSQVARQVQVHGDFYSAGSTLVSGWWRWFGERVLRQADAVRVVSKRIKDSLIQRNIPAEIIQTLPVYADLGPFLTVGSDRQYHTADKVSLLYVGRLAPEKKVLDILSAMADMVEKGLPVTLTIVGDGPERARIMTVRQQLHLEKMVTLSGWQEDLPEIMATHDGLILASESEGWGMVLLEAMAAGLPVITTDVGCVGEVVKDNVHGIVVDNSQQALKTAIEYFVQQPIERVAWGKAGHKTAKLFATQFTDYPQQWVRGIVTAISA